MEDFTGQYVGRYHIIETLGEGGMATVFKAYDDRLQREVALKIIRRSAVPPEQWDTMLKRFEREAISLAKLTHPNIVPVIDYGEFESSPYLVMVYLRGGSLRSKVGQSISYNQAGRWLTPIARALDYAHRRNLIHRDVKPGNILFTEDGESMLSDFGIAKILDSEESTSLTGTGVGVGTPKYMAPEQWLSKVLPQSDQYALGVVLFELVTGKPPYDGDSTTAILVKQATEPQPRPKDYVPDLPDQVEQVILKAMSKEPEDRFKDMGAFADALEGIKDLRQGAGSIQDSEMATLQVSSFVEPLAEPGKQLSPDEAAQTLQQKISTSKPPVVGQTDLPFQPSVGSLGLQPTRQSPEQISAISKPVSPPTTLDFQGDVSPLKSSEKHPRAWALGLPLILGGAFILGLLAVVLILVLFGSRLTFHQKSESPLTTTSTFALPTIPVLVDSPTSMAPEIKPSDITSTEIPQTPSINSTSTQVLVDTESNQISPEDEMELIYIPGGDFRMGSDTGAEDERPQRDVTLDAYWIDKTEITNAMYVNCINSKVCKPLRSSRTTTAGFENYPVVVDSWENASVYCNWVGRRLPTEAEWEKAANGLNGHSYPWGEEIKCVNANFGNCIGKLQPVGAYPKNTSPFGNLDMIGNVWEWVDDLYPDTTVHILKGGDWQTFAWGVRPAFRGGGGNICQKGTLLWGGSWEQLVGKDCSGNWRWDFNTIHAAVGFRCALSP